MCLNGRVRQNTDALSVVDRLRSLFSLFSRPPSSRPFTRSRNSYAHFFGKRGAKVVVNDVSAQSAQKVVDEIKQGE